MKSLLKRFFSLVVYLAITLGYIVWPADLMPLMPVDDIIIALIATGIEIFQQVKMTSAQTVA